MSAAKQTKINRNIILLILIAGLVAFAFYFYFFINPSQLEDTLLKTNVTVYAGAFVSYLLFAFFSGLVWRQLLINLSLKLTFRKALLFTWVGLFFEAVVPQLGWSGEISKTYLLSKDSNQDIGRIGASVVGQKLFTITITVVALSVGLGLLLGSYTLPFVDTLFITLILALSTLSLFVIYYVSNKPNATKTLLNWAIRMASFFRKKWEPQNFRSKAEGFLGRFHSGIKELKNNPKALLKPAVYAILGFVFEIGVMFVAFIALGQSVPVGTVLIVFTLTGTIQTVGIITFGFTEIVMTSIFSFLGIPVIISFSVTILTRIVTLWFRLVVSYIALQWAGIQIITKKQVSRSIEYTKPEPY